MGKTYKTILPHLLQMRLDSLRPTLKKSFGGMAVFLPVPIRDMKKPPPFLYEDLCGSS